MHYVCRIRAWNEQEEMEKRFIIVPQEIDYETFYNDTCWKMIFEAEVNGRIKTYDVCILDFNGKEIYK